MPTVNIPVILAGDLSGVIFALFASLVVISAVIWMVRTIADFIRSWLPV